MEIPCRMPCLIAGLSLKLSFDPHFVSLPSRVAPAGLVAGEWDVLLQSPQGGHSIGACRSFLPFPWIGFGIAQSTDLEKNRCCETCVMWWNLGGLPTSLGKKGGLGFRVR